MATKKQALDMFPQNVVVYVQQDAANSDKVVEVPNSYNTRDRVGMLILGCNVYPPTAGGFFTSPLVASGDSIRFGLSHLFRNGVAPDYSSMEGCICMQKMGRVDLGAAANGVMDESPYRFKLPEPVLAHPASLFCFMDSANLGAVTQLYFEIIFKYQEISDAVWQELWESILIRDKI
jgi:hypothetical protein